MLRPVVAPTLEPACRLSVRHLNKAVRVEARHAIGEKLHARLLAIVAPEPAVIFVADIRSNGKPVDFDAVVSVSSEMAA